jgi:uncharacterized membrane protein
MSQRWLCREGEKWVREGIISENQWKQILSRKGEERSHWLPVLSGILVGLGILSFVASNWDGIPPLMRLWILVISMGGFYIAGEIRTRKGFLHTGGRERNFRSSSRLCTSHA